MKVAIIMGSTSDLEIMSQAINVLEGFGVEVVKRVISAHRTPDLMCEFAKSAKAEGIGVIIAGAGGVEYCEPCPCMCLAFGLVIQGFKG